MPLRRGMLQRRGYDIGCEEIPGRGHVTGGPAPRDGLDSSRNRVASGVSGAERGLDPGRTFAGR